MAFTGDSTPPIDTEVVSRSASKPSPHPLTKFFFGENGLRAGWRLLVFFAILLAIVGGLAWVTRKFLPSQTPTNLFRAEILLEGELLQFGLVLLVRWIMAAIEGRTIADYGLPWRGILEAKFWRGALAGFIAISGLIAMMRVSGAIHFDGVELHGTELLKYAALWGVTFLFVALFEDFVFRGYVLFTLTTGVGFWPAAISTSLAFGYVHHMNSGETWVGDLAAGSIGLVFCLLLRRTGNLWMPIGFHAAWDWGETFFYGVPDSGQSAPGRFLQPTFSGPQWLTGGSVGPEGSVLCLAVIIVLGVVISVWLRETKYPNSQAIRDPYRHESPPMAPMS